MVAEGVKTAAHWSGWPREHGVEMPIAEQVAAIVEGTPSPRGHLALMERPARSEWARCSTGDCIGRGAPGDRTAGPGQRPAPSARCGGRPGPRADPPPRSGATADEIDRAAAEDVFDLLAVDRLLVPGPRRYTQSEVAELTGLPLDLLRRFWRALGFADVDRRRAGLHRPRHRGGPAVPGHGATSAQPTSTPPCSWPG